jgi:hypothetical protein
MPRQHSGNDAISPTENCIITHKYKYKASSLILRLLVKFAHGIVVELLSQGQMTGLCTWTYSPFLTTF